MSKIQLNIEGKPTEESLREEIKRLRKENEEFREKLNTKEMWVLEARILHPYMCGVEHGDKQILGIFTSKRRAKLEESKREKNGWFCYECHRDGRFVGEPLYHTNFEANRCNKNHKLERIIHTDIFKDFRIRHYIINESDAEEQYNTG